MRKTAFAVSLLATLPLLAQIPAKVPRDLKFEVATLKAAKNQGPISGIRPAPGGQRYQAQACPIRVMIQVAYRLKADQIVGGPSWLDSDLFDMEAKAEKPSTADELHVMLMNLLVERLHLKFHEDQKEMRMYALTVDKAGSKLTAHTSANAGEPWIDQSGRVLQVKMKATSSPMQYFAFRLSTLMDAPVVDQTNLPGEYDFTLNYTRELPPDFPVGGKLNGEEPDTSGPRIFEALKQQLGLELKPQKGRVPVLVIDQAEKPTDN